MNEEISKIVNQFNLNVIKLDHRLPSCSLGIGDILLNVFLKKNNRIKGPIIINLSFFNNTQLFNNPSNALEFRLHLLQFLIDNQNIVSKDILYIFNGDDSMNSFVNNLQQIPNIHSFSLNFFNKKRLLEEEYVVFHTKLRMNNPNLNIKLIKESLGKIFSSLKSKYRIVLIGERNPPDQFEAKLIHITSIYPELLLLKNNNDILDLTEENIYNNLNFDHYLHDLNLISLAKYNIICGEGGHLCTCLLFNVSSILDYTGNSFELLKFTQFPNNFYHDLSKFESALSRLY